MVWMGAAVVAQLQRFPRMLIWKQEYDTHGSEIVHARCF